MAWHTFEAGRAYARDEVVRICLDHIALAGLPLNKAEKRTHVDEIARLPGEVVTYRPFGRAWGRSPMNPRAWADRNGESFEQSKALGPRPREVAFVQGEVYRRRELHRQLGGQAQGGISTPHGTPVILIFTGAAGEQHGYADGWTDDGVFLYTGEGQRGDMTFDRGNAALRDQDRDGKDLYLFGQTKKGFVRYVGQMTCIGHRILRGPDTDGKIRDIIVFELIPFQSVMGVRADSPQTLEHEGLISESLDDLRSKALEVSVPSREPKVRRSQYRDRANAIKAYARKRAAGICEGCSSPGPFTTVNGHLFLEVHHVIRLSDGGPDHPASVVAVCPNCHRRAHQSGDAESFNEQLKRTARGKEDELSN